MHLQHSSSSGGNGNPILAAIASTQLQLQRHHSSASTSSNSGAVAVVQVPKVTNGGVSGIGSKFLFKTSGNTGGTKSDLMSTFFFIF